MVNAIDASNFFELKSVLELKIDDPDRKLPDFKKITNVDHISERKSKGLSEERIKTTGVSNTSLAPALNYINTKL